MRRFARQHRAASTVAAVSLLAIAAAIVAGFAAVGRQARTAEAERDRARLEAAKATQVSAFLREMLGSADPRTERTPHVRVASVLDPRRRAARDRAPGRSRRLRACTPPDSWARRTRGWACSIPPSASCVKHSRAGRRFLLPTPPRWRAHRRPSRACLLEKGELDPAEALYRQALAGFESAGQGDGEHALTARANGATALDNLGRLDEG